MTKLLESNVAESNKKEIWKIIFNLCTACTCDEMTLFLSTSKLPQILIKEILDQNIHHEYCLQILMNFSPNSSWFIEIDPKKLSDEFISRLRLILEGLHTQHDSFPSTIQLYNQPFDLYICPYFWILIALANYEPQVLSHIRESLFPDQQ